MNTGKISSIQGNGSFETANGKFYSFHVQLDGAGDTYEVNAKSETPRWKEGDSIWYTVTGEYKGVKKAKFSTQDPSAPVGARTADPATTKRIENSWAVQTAIQVLGPLKGAEDAYLDAIKRMAGKLLVLRDEVTPIETVPLK